MHKVKHVILIVLFLVVTAGMGLSVYYSIEGDKEADYVVETNVPFTPFEFYENREIVGVDVDIVNRVAEKMNKTIQIKNVERKKKDGAGCIAIQKSLLSLQAELHYMRFSAGLAPL